MKDHQVLHEISVELGLEKRPDALNKQVLYDHINDLINNDFEKLVSILYRMDVNETKLRQLLNANPGTDAALVIGEMMIERQQQKIISREQFSKKDENISDDEKW